MCLAGRICCAAQAGLAVAYMGPLDSLPPKDWDHSRAAPCLAQTILTVALSVLHGLDKCDTGCIMSLAT